MSLRTEIGLALLLALGVTIAVVAGSRAGAPTPAYEPASTFADGPTGSRALYEVLQRVGLTVERRRIPLFDLNDERRLPGLLVVVETEIALRTAELTSLGKYVRGGGAVLVAGRTGGIGPCIGWARQIPGTPLRHDSFPVTPAFGRELPPAATYLVPWRDTTGTGPDRCPPLSPTAVDTLVRTRSGRPVVLDFHYRRSGRILFVADDGWLRNQAWKNTAVPYVLVPLITEAAGGRAVVWDEYHHGYESTGTTLVVLRWLMGTPAGWVLAQLLLAALVALLVSAVRFGPARAVIDRRRRSPLEHLDALAAGLESSGGSATALGLIVGGLRRRLSRTGPVPRGAPDQWIAALALAMPTPQGRGAVRRVREALTKTGDGEQVLAAANSVEDVWQELRPRATRGEFSTP
ncbi:MAG TPA: DUF4350 domain-containing protein [Gemmatimonadales bacterium]|nr:DUF4350 domain-containing protein [Gemmatimonadales bacterium]